MHAGRINKIILDSILVKQKASIDKILINQISNLAEDIIGSIKSGGKLILAGNGGSYADAIHIAGEFVSKLNFDRKPLPAIALGSNNTILTAISNDYRFENIFTREFDVLAKKEDILLCISTSGNSQNILSLALLAKEKKINTFALTGSTGGKLGIDIISKEKCIKIPSEVTTRIQEMHITIGHIICEIVEEEMYKELRKS